jgi:hypothetical protein
MKIKNLFSKFKYFMIFCFSTLGDTEFGNIVFKIILNMISVRHIPEKKKVVKAKFCFCFISSLSYSYRLLLQSIQNSLVVVHPP